MKRSRGSRGGVAIQPHDRRGRRPGAISRPAERRHPRHVLRGAVVQAHLVARCAAAGRRAARSPRRRSCATAWPASAGATSQLPRCSCLRSAPRRFTPTRLPARTSLGSWSCTSHAAHGDARAPPGSTTSASPAAMLAAPQRAGDDRADALEREHAVHRQTGRPAARRRPRPAGRALERSQQLVEAAPVPGAHGDHLAAGEGRPGEELARPRRRPSRAVPRPPGRPWSARRRRARTPSSSRIARCSIVCGITPSSAATTSRNRSTPVAPATMVRTKRSCPGTSTTLRRAPAGSCSSA